MKEKAKRGRRKLPRFLLIVFILIATFLVFANSIEESSERIVYLDSAEYGTANLWMIDIENPDELRQLTFYDTPFFVYNYHVLSNKNAVVYKRDSEIILLDLGDYSETQLTECYVVQASCHYYEVTSSGDFVVYEYYVYPDVREIRLIDLTTIPHEERVISHFGSVIGLHPLPSVIGDNNILTFNLLNSPYEFQLYDIEANQFLEALPLGIPNRQPIFSDDGSRYVYHFSSVDIPPKLFEVRETDAPYTLLSRYRDWDSDLTAMGWLGATIYDWHPDNEHLLIGVGTMFGLEVCGTATYSSQFHIFNTTTGDIEALPVSGTDASWNDDGTQILSLGIQGVNPQWLDG